MKFSNTRTLTVLLFFLSFSGNVFSQAPHADFSSPDASGCSPHLVNFVDNSTGGGLTYLWRFGDPSSTGTSTSQSPSHNYTAPGQYTVTLVVTNGNGTDSIVKTGFVTVFNGPTANYTAVPDTVCSGTPITFTDASTPGDGAINSWDWTFNDGSPTIHGQSVQHPFTNNTGQITFYIPVFTPTDANGCNSIFSSDTVFILPLPTASFTETVNSCTFPLTVNFNTSSIPALYNWDFGDPTSGANNSSTLAQPSHTYNTAGSYFITLTNGITGCMAQDTMTLVLNQPLASFTTSDTIPCIGEIVNFTNTSTPSSATFNWTFGDNTSSTTISPAHSYSAPLIYTVKLVVSLGTCKDSTTQIIRVPPKPTASFTISDSSSCSVPFNVNFTADTSSVNVGWNWNFGDAGSGTSDTSTAKNPSHSYTTFGAFPITLTVTDIFGCTNSQAFNSILVKAPILDFTVKDSGCVGDIFTYDATVSSPTDTTITDFTWNFGDGTPTVSGPARHVTHQFNTTGVYDVTCTITTSTGCTATVTKQGFARVGTPPNAAIDSVFHSICFKGNVSFTDSTHQPVTGWLWFFGDGGSSTQENPSHQYNIDTSGTANPFDIILIAYYNGCADTDTVVNMVTVLAPIPFFDIAYNCINKDSVKFTNLTGGGDTYSWNFGDASTLSTDTSPSHIYAAPGDYNVVLSATNNASGCTVDTTLQVHIRNISAIANSNVTVSCFPAGINFQGSLSQDAASYHWDFGDPASGVLDSSKVADTLHVYHTRGTYTATLTTIDIHQCVSSDTQMVNILGPSAGFTANPFSGCSPINVNFLDTSHTFGGAINKWVWNYGVGGPNDTTLIGMTAHNYTIPGTYTVTLTVIDLNGCKDTHTSTNLIHSTKPIANIVAANNMCRNVSEQFKGSPGPAGTFAIPVTYLWDFGDGQTSSGTDSIVNHNYISNGNYHVHLLVTDNNGCTDTISKNIIVHTTSAHFTVTSTSTCVVGLHGIKRANVQSVFNSDSTDFASHANYDWNLTAFHDANSSLSNYNYNYDVPPGSYDATLILTNDIGCMDTFKIPGAVVVPGPTGSFTFQPDSGCTPLTVHFHGSSTNTNLYSWDFDDGNTIVGSHDSLVSHTYNAIGVFKPQFLLGFQLSNDLCYIAVPHTDSIKVTSLLGVNIVEDSVVIPNGGNAPLNVTINDPNNIGNYIYNWDPASHVANGSSSSSFLATSESDDPLYYYLHVPYGTQGCAGVDSVLVIPEPCEIKWDSIPNAFSPNGDYKNDTYFIKNLCYYDGFYIKIFNRWGRIIFESKDPGFHWDGTTSSGAEASEGVYYYVLHAKKKEWHGYIDLFRNQK